MKKDSKGIIGIREKGENCKHNAIEEWNMEYLFFARSSFCMGDDVAAPNMQRYEYSMELLTEARIKEYVTKYLSNVTSHKWNGYCSGELICSVYCDSNKALIVKLHDNWKSLLVENRTIWFDHHDKTKDKIGIIRSRKFTLQKALKLHEKTYKYVRIGEDSEK